MGRTALDVYLNDHLAGAVAGCELAAHLHHRQEGTAHAPFLAELLSEIEADRSTLERIMGELGVQRQQLKGAASWLLEKVSRLKLGVAAHGSAELGTLLAMETLSLGIWGKLALWRSLMQVEASVPELKAFGLGDLAQRAERQFAGLDRLRLEVAGVALSS